MKLVLEIFWLVVVGCYDGLVRIVYIVDFECDDLVLNFMNLYWEIWSLIGLMNYLEFGLFILDKVIYFG